jgi:hypothetical protein
MAILSIVIGYIVNGSMQSSSGFHTCAITSPLMSFLRPVPTAMNKTTSTSLIALTSSDASVSLSPSKDFDVVVFSPSVVTADLITPASAHAAKPTASTSSVAVAPSAVTGPAECDCGCGLLTWPARTDSTDLMLRPTTSALSVLTNTVNSISVFPSHTPSTGKAKGKAPDHDTSLYSLSTRMASSLSEYFGFSPIVQAVAADIDELLRAVDQLAAAITRHTAVAWGQSQKALASLRSELEYRNERARARARELREVGQHWVSSLKDHIKARTKMARENARSVKRRVEDPALRLARKAERQQRKQRRQFEKLQKRINRMQTKV